MPLKDRHKALLYHELSKLSKAGFAITEAAAAALDSRPPANQRLFLEELQRGVEAGKTLSGAAGAASANLTALEISILKAAEEGGKIAEGLAHLAHYFEIREKAARKIRAGLLYPALLLHLAVILPALPKAVISRDFQWQAFCVIATLLAIYLLLGSGYIALRTLSKKASRSAFIDGMLRKIPFVGRVRHAFALSRFCEVLHIHLLSGSGPAKAIRAAAQASASGRILASCRQHILPAIETGNPAGPVLIANGRRDFPPAFARAYSTGEESGRLDEEMQRWALTFADQAERAVDRMSAGLPKLIYLLVVILVIWQIFNMANMYFAPIEQFMDQNL